MVIYTPLEHPSAQTVLHWKQTSGNTEMEIVYERCAGLDVHKQGVRPKALIKFLIAGHRMGE